MAKIEVLLKVLPQLYNWLVDQVSATLVVDPATWLTHSGVHSHEPSPAIKHAQHSSCQYIACLSLFRTSCTAFHIPFDPISEMALPMDKQTPSYELTLFEKLNVKL